MKLLLLPVAGLLLLTGCGPSEEEREIKQQLAEIKAALAQLSQPPAAAVNEKETAADKVVELPKLPDNPTAQDIKEYAGKLLKYYDDSAIDRLDYDAYQAAVDAIPPGYIVELAPYLDDQNFDKKIPDWLVDEDKERILQKLPEEPKLLLCLPYMPYRYEDLRGPLLAMLQGKKIKQPDTIPREYIWLLVRDPEVCGQIKQLLFQNPDLYFLTYAFAERYGNQLIYDQLWETYTQNNQKIPMDLILARLFDGKTDAINVLAKEMESRVVISSGQWLTIFDLFPDMNVRNDENDPARWMVKYQNQFQFDPKNNSYHLPK